MAEQLTLPIRIPDGASFDNFFPGSSAEAVAALRGLAAGSARGPLYLYGAPGSGKSHLLFALYKSLTESGAKATYVSLDDPSVASHSLEAVDAGGALCLDDVQAWTGVADLEQSLFGLFERVRAAGGVWVAAGRRAPARLGIKLADLRSRLASGPVYGLKALSDHQRHAALRLRAECRGLVLGDESLNYLLKRVSRETSDLFALLDRIDRASLTEGRRITVPFLRQLITH